MLWLFTRVNEERTTFQIGSTLGGRAATTGLTTNRPVCIISKALKSQRLFVTFGTIIDKLLSQKGDTVRGFEEEGPVQQFKFYKNQEVPEYYYTLDPHEQQTKGSPFLNEAPPKAVQEDYIDFELTLIDNGDDKLCV